MLRYTKRFVFSAVLMLVLLFPIPASSVTHVHVEGRTRPVTTASNSVPISRLERVASFKEVLALRQRAAKEAAAKAILKYNTGVWTDSDVKNALSHGCDYYEIKGSTKTWLVAKGLHITHGENRGHVTWLKNTSSSATGLFQFLKEWGTYKCKHGVSDFRKCGTCACYRFIKAYHDGGDATLRGAWAATYY
jgi:phosphopantetheinyl transferase (holo-ACP synthase)